eukprot:1443403-Alexandrium_andersonii.AAC.1
MVRIPLPASSLPLGPLSRLAVLALLVAHRVPCLPILIHGVLPVRNAGARIAIPAPDLVLDPTLGIGA